MFSTGTEFLDSSLRVPPAPQLFLSEGNPILWHTIEADEICRKAHGSNIVGITMGFTTMSKIRHKSEVGGASVAEPRGLTLTLTGPRSLLKFEIFWRRKKAGRIYARRNKNFLDVRFPWYFPGSLIPPDARHTGKLRSVKFVKNIIKNTESSDWYSRSCSPGFVSMRLLPHGAESSKTCAIPRSVSPPKRRTNFDL